MKPTTTEEVLREHLTQLFLAVNSEDPQRRFEAAETLNAFGGTFINKVMRLSKDPNENVREYAKEILKYWKNYIENNGRITID